MTISRRDIATSLLRSYGMRPEAVALEMKMRQVELDIDSAVPCALIINELLSNALKHAFPEGRQGKLIVEMHQDESSHLRLRVADDGIGVPRR